MSDDKDNDKKDKPTELEFYRAEVKKLVSENIERSRKIEYQRREIKKIVEKLKNERYTGDQRYYLRIDLDKLINRFGMTDAEEAELDKPVEEVKEEESKEEA